MYTRVGLPRYRRDCVSGRYCPRELIGKTGSLSNRRKSDPTRQCHALHNPKHPSGPGVKFVQCWDSCPSIGQTLSLGVFLREGYPEAGPPDSLSVWMRQLVPADDAMRPGCRDTSFSRLGFHSHQRLTFNGRKRRPVSTNEAEI